MESLMVIWVLSTIILGALVGATLLHDLGVLIRVGDLIFESVPPPAS